MASSVSPLRAARRSLIAQIPSEIPIDRLAEIAQVGNPIKRASLSAIDELAQFKPGLVARLAGLDPAYLQARPYSGGVQSKVYMLGKTEVLKVVRQSVVISPREKEHLADTMKYEHAALVDYLSACRVPPHEISVGYSPFDADNKVIRILQPFCELNYMRVSSGEPDDIAGIRQEIDSISGLYPNILEELPTFIYQSQALYDDLALGVDIVGRNNLGIDRNTDMLTLLDAQPVTKRDPEDLAALPYHFRVLEQAVLLAATI